jgi:hypothetical protein
MGHLPSPSAQAGTDPNYGLTPTKATLVPDAAASGTGRRSHSGADLIQAAFEVMRRHRNFRAAWVFGVAGGERELPPAPALGPGVPDYPGFSHSAFLV